VSYAETNTAPLQRNFFSKETEAAWGGWFIVDIQFFRRKRHGRVNNKVHRAVEQGAAQAQSWKR
jgi:hypothetical protein